MMALQIVKPSPTPPVVAGSAAVEFLKDAFFLARRNARAAIGDFDHHLVRLSMSGQFNRCARWRIFYGIFEQVHQHQLDQDAVNRDER